MYGVLSSLKIYALGQEGMVDAELAAYDTGFLWLEDALGRLEQRAFVQTATTEDLLEYENLVGLGDNSRLNLANRRKMIIYRLSLAPYAFTTRALFQSFNAIGIRGYIREFIHAERIEVEISEYTDPWINMEQLTGRLESMLPAHLMWELDYGVLTWDMLELHLTHWNHWDEKDFTWTLFDNQGETIFP